MTGIGITEPSDANERTVRLNVGGWHVNVRLSALDAKKSERSPSGWTLGNLFERRWDKRLPVDADGRYVVDESPAAVKFLIHAQITAPSRAHSAQEFGAHLIAGDEKPCLPFVSEALGLSDPTAIAVTGGSTILVWPTVSRTSRTALQGWFPDQTLELKYRATRDGWTAAAFHDLCDDSQTTMSIFQVGNGRRASVVGGFSGVSWSGQRWAMPAGDFVFMLKDGTGGGQQHPFQPEKWGIKCSAEHRAVFRSPEWGPYFGLYQTASLSSDLKGLPGTLQTSSSGYFDIPAGSAILKLDGKRVSEIEVFRVCQTAVATPSPRAALSALDESVAHAVMPMKGEHDVRNFGVLIAGSLTEERMALRDAEIELRLARAKVSAAAQALEAVYGPDIAAGKEDPVVELSVRGTRMTTLRSTLQVCPDSALATRFDEARWPATEKDVDEHGRRVVDCCPSVFSKVLDVLRMRKRIAWAGGETQQRDIEAVDVAVKAVDREAFEEFVNMQFPGCESFVRDYVEFLEEPQAAV